MEQGKQKERKGAKAFGNQKKSQDTTCWVEIQHKYIWFNSQCIQ